MFLFLLGFAGFFSLFRWATAPTSATTGRVVFSGVAPADEYTAVAFTPSGKRLLTASGGDVVVYTRVRRTWPETARLEWGIGPLTALAVAPDGLTAAVGSDTGRVVVWELDG